MDSDKTSKSDESSDTTDTVPSVDPNADLNIEKLTKETIVPESNLNASLKVEEEPGQQGDSENKSNSKLFITGGVVAGLIILAIVGFIGFGFRSNQEEKKADIPIEQPKINQIVKEKPVIDRSEWTIEVLNGSGVSGAAKELVRKLEQLGYKILKIGNASNSNYKNNELYISKDFMDKADLLLEDLKDEINVASVAGELEDSTASARIIIGKDRI